MCHLYHASSIHKKPVIDDIWIKSDEIITDVNYRFYFDSHGHCDFKEMDLY